MPVVRGETRESTVALRERSRRIDHHRWGSTTLQMCPLTVFSAFAALQSIKHTMRVKAGIRKTEFPRSCRLAMLGRIRKPYQSSTGDEMKGVTC